MERFTSVQEEYASFLIRMWREVDLAASGAVAEWHGEVEHIQSGRHASFSALAEMLEDLRAQLLIVESASEETDEGFMHH